MRRKKVKVIGMTSPERLAIAPDVPTLKEQGTDIVNYGWWGVCAASGTPKPLLETLNKHVAAAVASPEFKTVIEKTGVIPVSSSVDELGALINDTAKEFGVLIKELGHRAAGLAFGQQAAFMHLRPLLEREFTN